MKRIRAIVLAAVLLCAALAGCGGGSKTWTGKHDVEITIANFGTVTVEVNADAAPETASNFLNLCKKGFYNKQTDRKSVV